MQKSLDSKIAEEKTNTGKGDRKCGEGGKMVAILEKPLYKLFQQNSELKEVSHTLSGGGTFPADRTASKNSPGMFRELQGASVAGPCELAGVNGRGMVRNRGHQNQAAPRTDLGFYSQ